MMDLETIHTELEAAREQLQHPGLTSAEALSVRLATAVNGFRQWTTEKSGNRVDMFRRDVEQIREQLAVLQPLFENAYRLHSGWLELSSPQAGGSGYDQHGKSTLAGAGSPRRDEIG